MGAFVLVDYLCDAFGLGGGVGGEFMQGAELVGGAVEEVGVGVELVLAPEGLGQFQFWSIQQRAHVLLSFKSNI